MTDKMTLAKFRASRRRVEDLAAELQQGFDFHDKDGNVIAQPGYVYDNGCHIEIGEGGLYLLLGRDDHLVTADRLDELELRLYDWAAWECYDEDATDADEKQALAIGVNFVNRLREVFHSSAPKFYWDQLRALNKAEPNPDVCHSHDFCDANEVMLEAATHILSECYGCEDVTEEYEFNQLMEICGRAWEIVRPLLGRNAS